MLRERVLDEGKLRHPEILAWIGRVPDRAVGTAGGAAVVMQCEVIQFRHDCGLGHQCRKEVVDAASDRRGVGPYETKVADPVRIELCRQFAHDSRMLCGVHPDSLDAVPVGFIVRCKKPELELPVVAGVVRDRSDRLDPLVFHGRRQIRPAQPRGAPAHEVEHQQVRDTSLIQVRHRRPELLESRTRVDSVVVRPVEVVRIGVVVGRFPVSHFDDDAPDRGAVLVDELVDRGSQFAIVPARGIRTDAKAIDGLEALVAIDRQRCARGVAHGDGERRSRGSTGRVARRCRELVAAIGRSRGRPRVEYGAVRSSAPNALPSSLNCTPTTPTLSAALAATETAPVTVAPLAGLVKLTVGEIASELSTVMVRAAVVTEFPAASRATAVSE